MSYDSRYPVPDSAAPWRRHPVAGWLGAAAMINFLVFFGISSAMGGDALGILPSRDGFVLKSHGQKTAVSQGAWVCNLFYCGGTLLLTPLIVFGALALSGWFRSRGERTSHRWIVCCFLAIWMIAWEWGIGSALYRSTRDWFELRPARAAAVDAVEDCMSAAAKLALPHPTNLKSRFST
jgi:hypothetical protein